MTLRKVGTGQNVLDAARERISHIFDRFDYVSVSFSGGKDSTVCLQLALEEARARGRVLDVFFWDEEAIPPETVEYVRRVSKFDGVSLRWFCMPVRHRNACSRKQPWWNPWNPDEKNLWCRPMPPEGITNIPNWERYYMIPRVNELIFNPKLGSVAIIMGIRTDESLTRYRAIASKRVDSMLAPALTPPAHADEPRSKEKKSQFITLAKPIYDWSKEDVWRAPKQFGWDYNRAYDTMRLAGISTHYQRCAPPYGEEPMRGFWMYSVCWPELWDKMTARVQGAATAGRYCRSQLYGYKTAKPEAPPPGQTWKEYIRTLVLKWGQPEQSKLAARLIEDIDLHNKKTGFETIPDVEPHPVTGLSWQFLAVIALRGDMKRRRWPANTVKSKHLGKGKPNG